VGARLARRPAPAVELDGRTIVRAATLAGLAWVALGAHVSVLAAALGATGPSAIAATIGGFALAFVLGILVVVAPAGLGVREAVLALCLGSVLPADDAVAVAIASRLLVTVVDGILAGVALLAARHGHRRPADHAQAVSQPVLTDATRSTKGPR
jgi:uncharacterized membrane protein YbhN (UPF0104 family)